MNLPEKFAVALIVVGYSAAELMLLQHGASVLDMGAALLIAAALLLAVFRRAAGGADRATSTACGDCAATSCSTCAVPSRPLARDRTDAR